MVFSWIFAEQAASLATLAAPTGDLSWPTVIASWGPSAGLFVWLLKLHRDLIDKVIPSGFQLIRKEMRRQSAESRERHQQHLKEMHALEAALGGQKTRAVKATRTTRTSSTSSPIAPKKKTRRRTP